MNIHSIKATITIALITLLTHANSQHIQTYFNDSILSVNSVKSWTEIPTETPWVKYKHRINKDGTLAMYNSVHFSPSETDSLENNYHEMFYDSNRNVIASHTIKISGIDGTPYTNGITVNQYNNDNRIVKSHSIIKEYKGDAVSFINWTYKNSGDTLLTYCDSVLTDKEWTNSDTTFFWYGYDTPYFYSKVYSTDNNKVTESYSYDGAKLSWDYAISVIRPNGVVLKHVRYKDDEKVFWTEFKYDENGLLKEYTEFNKLYEHEYSCKVEYEFY